MSSTGRQQILVAAMTAWFVLLLMPTPAESVKENWAEQIARHLREEKKLANHDAFGAAYDRYLTQLQMVHQALVQGNVPAVQKGMNRLVRMVAVREAGISESSAQSLLFYISEVTPVAYLDEITKSHLRLIREMVAFRAEAFEEPPVDTGYSSTVTPGTAPWGLGQFGWMGKGIFHPIFILGSGVLILVAVGVLVLLLMGLARASTESGTSVQTKEPAEVIKETHEGGQVPVGLHVNPGKDRPAA